MALRIGPKALDPMAGYAPSWAPGPGPVAPDGKGIPKWRALVLLVGVLILTANLPGGGPQAVQADAFAGNSVECTTSRHVLTTFNLQGYNYAAVSFHLSIPEGGTVYGRWEGSSGVIGTSRFWSAGTAGDLEWFVTSVGQSFGTGASGTATYALYKVAGYGGCYSVDNVSVMTVPVPANGPGGGLITPNPSQLQEDPEATEAPTPPPGYDCNGSTDIEGCDAAPAGWCWIQTGAMYGSVGYVLQQCEDEGDEPPAGGSETGSATDCTETAWVGDEHCIANLPNLAAGATGAYTIVVDGSGLCTVAVGCNGESGYTSGDVMIRYRIAGSGGGYQQVCDFVRSTTTADMAGSCEIAEPSVEIEVQVYGTMGWAYGAGAYAPNTGSHVTWSTSYSIDGVDTDGDGWSDDQEEECGSNPADDESVCDALPDDFPDPSGLPPGPGIGGGPVDQCEGPDDAALPMCGGFDFPTFPPWPSGLNATICASPAPAVAACAPIPSAFPDASGDIFTAYQPDPSGFGAQLAGKAPFGIVGQVQDALGGAIAAPAGPAVDLCGDIPVMGSDVEFCIPTDAFEAIGEWRWLMVIVVYIAVALGLLGVLLGSVGGKAATGSE